MAGGEPSSAGQNIQSEQDRLDRIDQKLDAKLDVGDPAVSRTLTQAYIGKLDVFKERIRSARNTLAANRSSQSPAWSNLSQNIDNAERIIASQLQSYRDAKAIDVPEAQRFSADIDSFLTTVEGSQASLRAETDPDKPGDVPLVSLLNELQIPNANEALAEMRAHYTANQLRDILVSVRTLTTLPANAQTELFGQIFDARLIANQLRRNTIGGSPADIVLGGGVENRLRALAQGLERSMRGLQEEIDLVAKFLKNELNALNIRTQKKADEESVNQAVLAVRRAEAALATKSAQMSPLATQLVKVRLILLRNQVTASRAAGAEIEVDRLLANVADDYGPTLSVFDPALAAKAERAIATLKQKNLLTPTDRETRDGVSLEETRQSVDQLLEARSRLASRRQKDTDAARGRATTLRREVRQAGPANAKRLARGFFPRQPAVLNDGLNVPPDPQEQKIFEKLLAGRQSVRFGPFKDDRGRNALTLRLTSERAPAFYVTTVTFPDQTAGEVRLSPAAYVAIQNVPAGSNIVILGQVDTTRTDALRRQLIAPSALDLADIGYVAPDGTVTRAAGEPVDVATEPNRQSIERQLGRRRSFTLEKTGVSNFPEVGRTLWTLSVNGTSVRDVTISTAAADFIEANDEPAEGTLAINPYLVLRDGMRLTVKDLIYLRRGPDGVIACSPAAADPEAAERVGRLNDFRQQDRRREASNGEDPLLFDVEPSADIPGLERGRNESVSAVQQVMDRSPALTTVKRLASTFQGPFQQLGDMFSAGMTGTKRESFVTYAREKAKPLLELLENPETVQAVADAKAQLAELKRLQSGGGGETPAEVALQGQIDALEGMVQLLSSPKIKDVLVTIVRTTTFDADTWAKWLSTEAPKILITIAAAVAATALVIATCGTATPLVVLALAGAAGGVIGSQLGSELVFQGQQLFDSRVRSGELTVRDRSLLGKYIMEGKAIDPVTGEEVSLSFLKDVASPLLQELAVSFALAFATMGAGNVAGKFIGRYVLSAAKGKAVDQQAVALLGRQVGAVQAQYSQLAASGGTNIAKSLVRRTFERGLTSASKIGKETGEELGEEAVESLLSKLHDDLGAALSIVTTASNRARQVRLARGVAKRININAARLDGDKIVIPCSGDASSLATDLAADLERDGYPKATATDGTVTVALPGGGEFVVTLEVQTDPVALATEARGASGYVSDGPQERAVPLELIALKTYLKANTIDAATRRQLAEALLGIPLTPEQAAALEEAHLEGTGLGAIDEYPPEVNRAKSRILLRQFAPEQARLLLDSGLAGDPPANPKVKEGPRASFAMTIEAIAPDGGLLTGDAAELRFIEDVPNAANLIQQAKLDAERALSANRGINVCSKTVKIGNVTYLIRFTRTQATPAPAPAPAPADNDLVPLEVAPPPTPAPIDGSGPELAQWYEAVRLGKVDVSVWRSARNGKPAYLESGWRAVQPAETTIIDGQVYYTFQNRQGDAKPLTLEQVWESDQQARQQNQPLKPAPAPAPVPAPLPEAGPKLWNEAEVLAGRQTLIVLISLNNGARWEEGWRIAQPPRIDRSEGEPKYVIEKNGQTRLQSLAALKIFWELRNPVPIPDRPNNPDPTRQGVIPDFLRGGALERPPIRLAPNREPFTEGEEIYVYRNAGVFERGWYVRWNPGIKSYEAVKPVFKKGVYTQVERRDLRADTVRHIAEVEAPLQAGQAQDVPEAEVIRRREALKRQAPLSEQDFFVLFNGPLMQSNVGNCYLIAAFNSLRMSPDFEAIVRTAIKPVPGGYEVYLPLGSRPPATQAVTVRRDDLRPQTGTDGRRREPVDAAQGWQVLEAAYAIQQFGRVDRQAMGEGGFGGEALSALFGPTAVSTFQLPYRNGAPLPATETENYLNTFNNGKDIGTANTRRNRQQNDAVTFRIDGIEFYECHAYSIQTVDKFARSVSVVNPHDTSQRIVLTYEQFRRAFTDLSGVRINPEALYR